MDRKNTKCGTYYGELVKRTGLIVPAFAALAMFAVFFVIRFVDMFGKLQSLSSALFWVIVAFALIGCIFTIVYIASKLKREELGSWDTLLFTLGFLMVYLFFGMIIFKFVSLDTVYYAVALIITVVLTVLRVKFAKPEVTEEAELPAPNIGLKKYFEAVVSTYGIWVILLAALITLGALLMSDALNLPSLFLSEVSYTVGWLLVGAIAFVTFVFCMAGRIASRRLGTIDGFVVFVLFAVIFAIIPVLFNGFSVIKFALWLVALCLGFTFIRILALNTYVSEEITDDSFFKTDASKKFIKGPKVYFRQLFKKFDVFAICALALMTFAVLGVFVSVDFLSWAGKHNYMLYTVLAILIVAVIGVCYLAKTLKRHKIGTNDALLAIMDISLLLLVIPIFIDFGGSKIASLIIWAIAFAICLGISIARLFMVREPVPEEETAEEVTEPEAEEAASDASEATETAEEEKTDEEVESSGVAEAEGSVEDESEDAKKN